jgi:hypothetical protein
VSSRSHSGRPEPPTIGRDASGSRHSDGSGSLTPPAPTAARADIRISRRAALNIMNASGSSTKTAEAMLGHMSSVRRSRITSNQASQHSIVAVISRPAITICLPHRKAQPVTANAPSSTKSNPTHASLQWVATYSRRRVMMSTTIQAASTTQEIAKNRTPIRRRRSSFRSSIGCG